MDIDATGLVSWITWLGSLDPPGEWTIERAPHRDAADWALQGPVLPILALTILHLLLRGASWLGWIHYDATRLLGGLRGAAIAVNALFQPHARDPTVDKAQPLHVDHRGEPPLPPSPDLADEHQYPDDGLRRPTVRDAHDAGSTRRPSTNPIAATTKPTPNTAAPNVDT